MSEDSGRLHAALRLVLSILIIGILTCSVQAAAESHMLSRSDWDEVIRLAGIGAVPSKTRITIFCDPNCPYCAKLWRKLQSDAKATGRIRWIPVAYLSSSSQSRAVALLEAADPEKALEQNFSRYIQATRSGGIAPAARAKQVTQRALQRSHALWSHLGGLTPLLLYRLNGKVLLHAGLPSVTELQEILAASRPVELEEYVEKAAGS